MNNSAEQNIKSHFGDCKGVLEVIDNANALLTKAKQELEIVREGLIALKPNQHPAIRMPIPFHLRRTNSEAEVCPSEVIDRSIARINALLGDRV